MSTIKLVTAMLEKAAERIEKDTLMAQKVRKENLPAAEMQNTRDVKWFPVEQDGRELEGWDLTGQEGQPIEQNFPVRLNDPLGDFIGLRVDKLRDKRYFERRVMASADKIAAGINRRTADAISTRGSLYYESATAGFDFVADARTLMRERQVSTVDGMSFVFNDRAYQAMGTDLASRSDLSGRPETAYGTAMVGKDVAGFDVFSGSYLQNISAAAGGTTTVAVDLVDVPRATITVGGEEVNDDYRYSDVTLTDASTFNVGDVIEFQGINALGLMDKIDTGNLMTAKVVAKSGNVVTVYPRLIAAGQADITSDQAASANISAPIVATTVVQKKNTTGGRSNLFFANDSIMLLQSDTPVELLNEWGGMKVAKETTAGGIDLYMAYDADLATMGGRCRLFTRYGIANCDPSRNGVAVYTG